MPDTGVAIDVLSHTTQLKPIAQSSLTANILYSEKKYVKDDERLL